MPGAVDLNPDTVNPLSDIAEKVGEREDGSAIYQAGPDAKGYDEGQFVPNDYANKARKIRQNANSVKAVMRRKNVDEDEARQRVKDVIEAKEDYNQGEIEEDDLDRIRRNRVGS
jgi:flagellar motility protein MotE (MotC chaperone)